MNSTATQRLRTVLIFSPVSGRQTIKRSASAESTTSSVDAIRSHQGAFELVRANEPGVVGREAFFRQRTPKRPVVQFLDNS